MKNLAVVALTLASALAVGAVAGVLTVPSTAHALPGDEVTTTYFNEDWTEVVGEQILLCSGGKRMLGVTSNQWRQDKVSCSTDMNRTNCYQRTCDPWHCSVVERTCPSDMGW